MRLTYKETSCGFDFYKLKPDVGEDAKAQKWNKYDALNKLGQLEDTEEELGIDLVTLFKALFEGIFVKRYDGGISFWEKPALRTDIKPYCFDFFDPSIFYCPKLSDYGKTWALTKEELK